MEICPCCGYPTFDYNSYQRICFLCDWQNGGEGGPNRDYKLYEAKDNFQDAYIMYDQEDHYFKQIEPVIKTKKQITELFDAIEKTDSDAEKKKIYSKLIKYRDFLNAELDKEFERVTKEQEKDSSSNIYQDIRHKYKLDTRDYKRNYLKHRFDWSLFNFDEYKLGIFEDLLWKYLEKYHLYKYRMNTQNHKICYGEKFYYNKKKNVISISEKGGLFLTCFVPWDGARYVLRHIEEYGLIRNKSRDLFF